MDSLSDRAPASYRRCIELIEAAWPSFQLCRADRLRHSAETEGVAEAITEDLFTAILDREKGDLMYQIAYADIVVGYDLAKYLVIETKRPGRLLPGRPALEAAVAQARRYAGEQKIHSFAATDGRFLYAADTGHHAICSSAYNQMT